MATLEFKSARGKALSKAWRVADKQYDIATTAITRAYLDGKVTEAVYMREYEEAFHAHGVAVNDAIAIYHA